MYLAIEKLLRKSCKIVIFSIKCLKSTNAIIVYIVITKNEIEKRVVH